MQCRRTIPLLMLGQTFLIGSPEFDRALNALYQKNPSLYIPAPNPSPVQSRQRINQVAIAYFTARVARCYQRIYYNTSGPWFIPEIVQSISRKLRIMGNIVLITLETVAAKAIATFINDNLQCHEGLLH